jgi:hypothetical protein
MMDYFVKILIISLLRVKVDLPPLHIACLKHGFLGILEFLQVLPVVRVVVELLNVFGNLRTEGLFLNLQGEACEPLDSEDVADILLEEFREEEVVEPELTTEADQVLIYLCCLLVI